MSEAAPQPSSAITPESIRNFLPGSFVLDEFRHQQVAYARSAPVAFTVP